MLKIFTKRWKAILLISVIAAALAALIALVVPAQYKTQITYYALNFDGESQSVPSSSISAAQALAKDYVRIVKSDIMISKISAAFGGSLSYDRIQDMITADTLPASAIFEVSVKGMDKNTVQTVTDVLTANFEKLLAETVGRQNAVTRLSLAEGSETAVAEARNYAYITAAGALLGFFGSFIFFLCYTKDKERSRK